MAFRPTRRTRSVMLMVPAWPESGFREGAARLRLSLQSGLALQQHERGIDAE
jgi:hypothetical protein